MYIYAPNVHIDMRIYTCLHGHFIALSCLISSYYSQHFSFYSCSFLFLRPPSALLLYLLPACSRVKTMAIGEQILKNTNATFE